MPLNLLYVLKIKKKYDSLNQLFRIEVSAYLHNPSKSHLLDDSLWRCKEQFVVPLK